MGGSYSELERCCAAGSTYLRKSISGTGIGPESNSICWQPPLCMTLTISIGSELYAMRRSADRARMEGELLRSTKACLQTGFPNRSKIDSRLEMEISLDSIDVERGPMGPDRAGAVGQSQ